MTATQSGYAEVNGLRMYYEIHGSGGTPLLLLHGGLFDIDQQFGELLPGLAEGRQVIAAVGMPGLNAVWTAPETLPTRAEIESPRLWLERVHPSAVPG